MRNRDHKDIEKHIRAMKRIQPCCTAKIVHNQTDTVLTMRLLIDWRGRRIRAGLVIGGLVDGDAHLTDAGMLCVNQWMRSHPTQTIIFAEFKHVATGNINRLRSLLTKRLDEMSTRGDNVLLILAAKNSVMYDKIGALIDLNHKMDA